MISHIHLNRICSFTLISLGFIIPVSTSATYVVLGIFLLFWVLDNFKAPLKKLAFIVKSNPVAMACCAFFLIHVAGLCYTPAGAGKNT